ncbi:MAG TPA: DNA primase [Actinomycetota bacterium]|nr:DNA primase [Actinomycetota bacterium]
MAKIRDEDIDVLRERADLAEIISAYTELKRSGGHTVKGLCPFHSEKTPSFTVDTARGLWHCFGCKEGGNVYQFVEKVENLPFPEAVEWVARKVGFELRYEEMRPGEAAQRGVKARLIEANNEAARFFHQQLMTSQAAVEARNYLGRRGFDREVSERWQLGFAPGANALCRHLLSKKFTQDEIKGADLGRISERDGSLYDVFRNRITFPTWDLQGDVVGFGARALGDAQPKYLNTSETPVFSKSRVMYGLNRAKSAIARGAAVVVEGYTDVIALHEAGVYEAVATNGTALGETHFEQLKRFSSRAVLMFDADTAGKGATERGFGIHQRIGLEVLVAPLDPGRDPADVVADMGAEGIRKVIEAAEPLMEFKLRQTIADLPLDTPEARSGAVRQVLEILRSQTDPIARHQYVDIAARLIGVDADMIHRALSEQRNQGVSPDPGAVDRDRRIPGHVKVEREALQLLLTQGRDVEWASDLVEEDFTSSARRELFRNALEMARAEGDPSAMAQRLSPDALALFTELIVGQNELDPEELESKSREVPVRLRVFRLERDIKNRRGTLQEINPLVDGKRHDDLFTELVGLEAARRDLLRKLQGAA